MTHIVTANSPFTDMVFKSILKELLNTKVAKKNYKQNYQQAKASVASATTTPVTRHVTVLSRPTSAITAAIVATALKVLKTTPITKPKVTVQSTSIVGTDKNNSKTSGSGKNTRKQECKLLNSYPPFKN